MILPGEFFGILARNARINRMTARRMKIVSNRHRKIEARLEEGRSRLSEKELAEYIRGRVRLEASMRMHDEGVSHIRFTSEECPLTYDLMVGSVIPLIPEIE